MSFLHWSWCSPVLYRGLDSSQLFVNNISFIPKVLFLSMVWWIKPQSRELCWYSGMNPFTILNFSKVDSWIATALWIPCQALEEFLPWLVCNGLPQFLEQALVWSKDMALSLYHNRNPIHKTHWTVLRSSVEDVQLNQNYILYQCMDPGKMLSIHLMPSFSSNGTSATNGVNNVSILGFLCPNHRQGTRMLAFCL